MYRCPHCEERTIPFLKKARSDYAEPTICSRCGEKSCLMIHAWLRINSLPSLVALAGAAIAWLVPARAAGGALVLAGLLLWFWLVHCAKLFQHADVPIPKWYRPLIEMPNDVALKREGLRYQRFERLSLFRAQGLGSAAICVAILLAATQVGTHATSMKMAVISAAVALPMWALYGFHFDSLIGLGERGFASLVDHASVPIINQLQVCAGAFLVFSMACVVWFLLPEAGIVFGVVVVLTTYLTARLDTDMADWWAAGSGQDEGTLRDDHRHEGGQVFAAPGVLSGDLHRLRAKLADRRSRRSRGRD